MMKVKLTKSILATFLAMVLYAISTSVFASTGEVQAEAHANPSSAIPSAENKKQDTATVVGELSDLRDSDTKYFKMSDGTTAAVQYGQAVTAEKNFPLCLIQLLI